MTTATRNAKEVTVKSSRVMEQIAAAAESATYETAAEELKAQLAAMLEAARDEAMARARPEVVDPQGWWDIVALGPIQPGAVLSPPAPLYAGPLLSHQVIRVGQPAFVASIIILNPVGPSVPTAREILGGFALPYEVSFHLGNLSTWTPAGSSALGGNLNLSGFAINVLALDTSTPGLYEMNITARIHDATGGLTPPFSGFARRVIDVDPDLFVPAPGLQYDFPIRYQVYA